MKKSHVAFQRTRGPQRHRWSDQTRQEIMEAHQQLVAMGMPKPSIRAVLYLLMGKKGAWVKADYNHLCVKLGQWRDARVIEFGLFADDGAGSHFRPSTAREIQKQIEIWARTRPLGLPRDQFLHVVFVEHQSMVDMLADLFEYRVPVVSSQGELRREHLHAFISECVRAGAELGGKGIKVHSLCDYDKGGRDISAAHRRFLEMVCNVTSETWGITERQVDEAGLDPRDDHQLDGWIAAYGIGRFKDELYEVLQL